ncbi:MalY/PatB family protein [Gracilibacillus sp. S3-1-1]|uniref:MalY/PatB family protein n=1 Tax=Gracilibacillus pellucidus TaxID=3095368 RepID=A0ACC6M1G2_9BACI|nr:MalY/PatB family protein [Gracilibacillus sp. S3-1-1]MDX8044779.1 MalY/PatB family protein [Gracilibacillus sp. S3-1-1]
MTFSFDKQIERRNTRAVKWDLVQSLYGSKDVLPMWVADMDFEVPPAVKDALVERVQHGVFGYTFADPALQNAITGWLDYKHDWQVKSASILYSPGVITTLYMAIQTFTHQGDKVLIQTPVYPPFYDIVKRHDRQLVTSQLKVHEGKYEMDFDDFEAKLQQGVKAFILCNPHNPVGRVWKQEELEQIVALCKKYNVLILADEIHADLVYKPNKHIPIAKIDEEMTDQIITCMSPTKTFNLAGLQASYVIVTDKEKREALEQSFNKQGVHMLNTMGITAIEAAYNNGREWLDGLLAQLEENIDYVVHAFQDNDKVEITRPEGTYLVWMDFRKLGLSQDELKEFLQKDAKIGLNDGATFGEEGIGFMRMNVACPLSTVKEGTERILAALEKQ